MRLVKVWDIFVRIFHWTLVSSMIGMYLSAESLRNLHVNLGHFVIILVLSRILWGFIGTKHARFSDFIYSSSEIYIYLKGLIKGAPKHYVGHNPAGGLMIIVMLFSLLLTTLTGLKAVGLEGRGLLADSNFIMVSLAYADRDKNHDKFDHHSKELHTKGEKESFWEEIHEVLTSFMILLIIGHIGGVIVSSWVHKENLVLAMITGKKKVESQFSQPEQPDSPLR